MRTAETQAVKTIPETGRAPQQSAGARGQVRSPQRPGGPRSRESVSPSPMKNQKKSNRRLTVFAALCFCLLLLNMVFLTAVYRKMRSMEELLLQAAARQETISAEDVSREYQTAPEYQASDSVTSQTLRRDYPEIWGLKWVDSPVERTERQVLERLKELAEDSELIGEIYENRSSYPDKLLEALANNPEMAGFVQGYPDSGKTARGGLTESEKEKDFPLFLQWDPRWGYAEYGDDSCIGIAGCGPTCISMALYYLTGNETLTPDVIGDYSMANGYYVSEVGTAWALLEDVPALYGIEVEQIKIREENIDDVLEDGGVIIASMSAGDFTASGHFIVIYGRDSEGYLVNDPNCVARSNLHWTWEQLQGQMKNLWAYRGSTGSVVRTTAL